MNDRIPVLGAVRGNASVTHPDSIFGHPGKPSASDWLIETVARLWSGYNARQTGARPPAAACEIDLGPDETAPYRAEIVDLSLSGCVVRLPASLDPAAHMYNIVTVDLESSDDEPFKLYGTIVRVESDTAWNECASVLARLRFTALDESNRESLLSYIDRCCAEPGS